MGEKKNGWLSLLLPDCMFLIHIIYKSIIQCSVDWVSLVILVEAMSWLVHCVMLIKFVWYLIKAHPNLFLSRCLGVVFIAFPVLW